MSLPSIERSGCSLRTVASQPAASSSTPACKTSETPSLQQAYWNGELWKEPDRQYTSRTSSSVFTGPALPSKSNHDVTRFLQRQAKESETFAAMLSLQASKPIEGSDSIDITVIGNATRKSIESSLSQGLSVRAVVDRTHWSSESEIDRFIDAYIAVSSEHPKHTRLHSDAVKDKPCILAERQSAKEREVLEQIDMELNRPAHENTIRLMQVRAPLPVQQHAMMNEVVQPISDAFDMAMGMIPIAGNVWTAYEAAIGKTMGGLGERISDDQRVMMASFSLIPVVGRLMSAGVSVAVRTLAFVAKKLGRPTREVMALLTKAQQLKQAQVVKRLEVTSQKTPFASRGVESMLQTQPFASTSIGLASIQTVPSLAQATGREMMREAIGVLKNTSPEQRVVVARALFGQIEKRAVRGAWKAIETPAAHGATAWTGETHAFVIDATGNIHTGLATELVWGGKGLAGTKIVAWDKLSRIQ